VISSPNPQQTPQTAVTENKGMTDEQFTNLVAQEIRDALAYIDGTVSPERTLNYQYYQGIMEDVPAVEGRSSVVVSVVADYTGFMLPSLLRTMIAGRKIVEYQPKGDTDQGAAKQATDYVNETVMRYDNRIENVCYGWGFDGLVNKVGVVKVWWEEEKEYKDFNVQVPPDPQGLGLVMAVQQAEQQGLSIEAYGQDPQSGAHQLVLRQTIDKSHVKFEVLPPEEFVISRDARTLESARLKSHRTYKYAGELIEEGYDPQIVASLPSYSQSANLNAESQARQPDLTYFGSNNAADPMLKKIAVHSGTVLCDKDGTGLKEWYFVAGGWANNIKILESKEFEDEVYFCDFCPIPLPHLFFGKCPADDLVAIQRVQTVLARGQLDNVYLTNSPQREVVLSQIVGQRIEYVQNMSPGGIIPVTAVGAVNNVTVPWMGDAALNLMNYWDGQAENVTGAGRNTLGLDPMAVQNQSATAAALQDTASKLKMETMARIWASGGMRKLGRAILRILKRRQDFARMVKMNGVQQPVDPRVWAEMDDWDVTVNTGLGTGDRAKDVQSGLMIIGKMEEILLKLGPNNPIVSLPMLSHAYQDMAELLGAQNPDKYFKTLPLTWQPPPAPPQDPPQVQAAKINAGANIEIAQIKAGSSLTETQIDNQINWLLGIREQNIQAQLKATEIAVDHHHNSQMANIAKVKGQRPN
jgi:hypothetical protein